MSYNSYRNTKPAGNPVSLFPFLAVLLCTMGALIVVLMILARQAEQSADKMVREMVENSSEVAIPKEVTKALPTPDEAPLPDIALEETETLEETEKLDEIQSQIEMSHWRAEQLQTSLVDARREQELARIALGGTQQNRNRLIQEMETFRQTLIGMQQNSESDDPEEIRSKISEKEREIERLRQEIAKAENTAKERGGSYAILPHVGPNGTQRYPIYIECREDGAWLMPENIRLSTPDFEGVLTMGNPLEAALLAKRETLLQQGVFQETPDRAQEPYPLLVVRPGGIMYLYMVRSALQSWKAEYGFELVDSETKLAYPPRDAYLKQQMESAITQARQRQSQIAAMAPTLSRDAGGSGGGIAYRPTYGGGVAVNIDPDSRLARTLRESSASSGSRRSQASQNLQASQPTGAYGANASNVANTESVQNSEGTPKTVAKPAALPDVSQWTVAEDAAEDASDSGKPCGNPDANCTSEKASENQSIAAQQGSNWALDAYRPNRTALSKPLPMECRRDRYVLSGTPGVDQVEVPITVPYETIQKLAKEISAKLREWGQPGPNMYWRPILRVRVASDAQEEFEILRTLLRDSGLEVEEVK